MRFFPGATGGNFRQNCPILTNYNWLKQFSKNPQLLLPGPSFYPPKIDPLFGRKIPRNFPRCPPRNFPEILMFQKAEMPWFLVPYGAKLGWFFRGGGRGGPSFSSNFRQLKFRQKPPRFRTPRPSFCPPKRGPLFAKNPILFYEPSRQKSFFYPQKTPENPPRDTPRFPF